MSIKSLQKPANNSPTKEDLLQELAKHLTVEELQKLVKAVKNPVLKSAALAYLK